MKRAFTDFRENARFPGVGCALSDRRASLVLHDSIARVRGVYLVHMYIVHMLCFTCYKILYYNTQLLHQITHYTLLLTEMETNHSDTDLLLIDEIQKRPAQGA